MEFPDEIKLVRWHRNEKLVRWHRNEKLRCHPKQFEEASLSLKH